MKHSSQSVLDALGRGPLRRGSQHAWLYEVRNGTGFSRSKTRTADALVFSCWPSRGLWLAGVEVKVDRGDWLRELDDPHKAEGIQPFCNYWWVAAPVDIVRVEEVPKAWGYYEVGGKSVRCVKDAPKLEAKPLDVPMLASLFRNWDEQVLAAERRGESRKHEELTGGDVETEARKLKDDLYAAKNEKQRLEQSLGYAQRDLATLRHAVDEFERSVGMKPGDLVNHGWSKSDHCYALAKLLVKRDLKSIAKEMRACADSLDGVASHASETEAAE